MVSSLNCDLTVPLYSITFNEKKFPNYAVLGCLIAVFLKQALHWDCDGYLGWRLLNFFVPNEVLIRGWRLFGGSAYLSKYMYSMF